MESFKFEPLGQSGEFRILKLHPAQSDTDEIVIDIRPELLHKAPDYEAVSYTWDNQGFDQNIIANNRRFQISKNCRHILLRLRLKNKPRLLWIDQICINQNDVSERNGQVQLMYGIYYRTVRLVIWLGLDECNEVGTALAAMDHIFAACMARYDHVHQAPVFEIEVEGDFDPQIAEDWVLLGRFFSRSWFFRVWCIQEAALARTQLVLCGGHEVEWDKLHLTVEWIEEYQELGLDLPRHLKEIDIRGAISMYRANRNWADPNKTPLLEYLNHFRHSLATDPRDKVYAIQSLKEGGGGEREEKPPANFDYGKSVCEVYTDVARVATQNSKNLSVLSFVSHESTYCTDTTFPSWVPRWDRPLSVQMLWSSQEPWSASANRKLEEFVPELSGAVSVRGVQFDSVESTTDVFSDLNEFESNVSAQNILLQLWNECPSVLPSHPHPHTAITTLAKTLVAENHWEGVSNCSTTKCDEIYNGFLALMNKISDDRGSRSEAIDPGGYLALSDGDWGRFQTRCASVCRNRRIFRTKRGYYGLGPACMEVGDIAVVLFGGTVPYILRSMPTNYAFLGAAYIDGIMYGELFDGPSDIQKHEEQFYLR